MYGAAANRGEFPESDASAVAFDNSGTGAPARQSRWRVLFLWSLISCLLYRILLSVFPAAAPAELSVQLKGPRGEYAVYFDRGNGYLRSDSISALMPGGDETSRLKFSLAAEKISRLRFDLGNRHGSFVINEICLLAADRSEPHCWRGAELLSAFRPRQDIADFYLSEGRLAIRAYGNHPYFESVPAIDAELVELTARSSFFAATYALLGAAILTVLIGHLHRRVVGQVCRFGRSGSVGVERGKLMLSIAAALGLAAVVYLSGSWIARTVPPYQGPDENDHFGRLISFIEGRKCGFAPADFSVLLSSLSRIPRHPTERLTASEVRAIFSSPQQSIRPILPLGLGACSYNSAYLLPIVAAVDYDPNREETSTYLTRARYAITRTAAVLWGLILFLALFGQPIWNLSPQINTAIRFGAVLGIVQMALLPQTLFFSGVLNQDYLLIAAGSVMAVSAFLRLSVLSDLLILVALVAAASKIFYLPPFILLAAVHYSAVFFRWRPHVRSALIQFFSRNRWKICTGAAVLIVCALPIARLIGASYCRSHWCYRLERASLLNNLPQFFSDLATMRGEFTTLAMPHSFYRDSAFGAFGWLDSFLHSGYAELYSFPLSVAAICGAVICPFVSFRRGDCGERRGILRIAGLAVVYLFVSLLMLYFVAVLMQGWCGNGASFGCGYQKRYELPLYGFFSISFFALGIFSIGRIAGSGQQSRFGAQAVFVVFLCAQLAAAAISVSAQRRVLDRRYFDSPETASSYRQLALEAEGSNGA